MSGPDVIAGHTLLVAALIALVSLLYATAGQAGGTAFLAIMTFAAFPSGEMRPTALVLNIVAAGYATWRLYAQAAIDGKMLMQLTGPSLATAFLGGLLMLGGRVYFMLTGLLLISAAILMAFKGSADNIKLRPVGLLPATLVGAGSGFVSGLTGVGGGVFLMPQLVAFGWASPKQAAALSPPFILCNSVVGLIGVLLAGQQPTPGTPLYSAAALGGAVIGTGIGLRFMSERATRYVLAVVLLLAGIRLLGR
jgi:uncharacterized protein